MWMLVNTFVLRFSSYCPHFLQAHPRMHLPLLCVSFSYHHLQPSLLTRSPNIFTHLFPGHSTVLLSPQTQCIKKRDEFPFPKILSFPVFSILMNGSSTIYLDGQHPKWKSSISCPQSRPLSSSWISLLNLPRQPLWCCCPNSALNTSNSDLCSSSLTATNLSSFTKLYLLPEESLRTLLIMSLLCSHPSGS